MSWLWHFRGAGIAMWAASALLVGCGEGAAPRETSEQRPTAEDPLELGLRYLTEKAYRRRVLEQSLLVQNNGYAALRLKNYGIDAGWEALPELDASVTPLVYRDGVQVTDAPERVWTGDVEWTEAALLALGKAAFERWPAQPVPTLELALGERDDPALARSLGLWRTSEGWLGGLVWATYASGATALAATCATCHARVNDGATEHGPASDLELGYGPGMLDVTADDADNPVAIADLRATVHQRRLHWTGNVENGLIPLAVRIETLLITNSGALTRPPRELAFALALYVQSLGRAEPSGTEQRAGRAVFESNCARCHEAAGGAGDWVSVDELGGDSAAALSPERGTGGYRVSSLRFVASRTRLTHQGFPGALESFLSAGRAEEFPGHPFGLELESRERADLIEYLSNW